MQGCIMDEILVDLMIKVRTQNYTGVDEMNVGNMILNEHHVNPMESVVTDCMLMSGSWTMEMEHQPFSYTFVNSLICSTRLKNGIYMMETSI
jgi:hypothetical protein